MFDLRTALKIEEAAPLEIEQPICNRCLLRVSTPPALRRPKTEIHAWLSVIENEFFAAEQGPIHVLEQGATIFFISVVEHF
jgi:hypothetical protein